MALRLMRSMEVPATPRDLVFRYSPARALLFAVALVCVAATLAILRWPGPRAAFWIAGVLLFLLLLTQRFITARFRQSNWLVRLADDGAFVQFRSCLNYHLPSEDQTVVFIPFADVRSARLVRERTKTADNRGGTAVQTRHIVELELESDPALLAAALKAESKRQAPREAHWYGTSSTLYRQYPVLMPNPPYLRLEWQVVPRAAAFLDALRPHVTIAPTVALSEDFVNLGGLSREQQQQRLRELDQRGQTIAAVYMARRLYGLDLTQATAFVESLREDVPS
jgi:hypothetical protein